MGRAVSGRSAIMTIQPLQQLAEGDPFARVGRCPACGADFMQRVRSPYNQQLFFSSRAPIPDSSWTPKACDVCTEAAAVKRVADEQERQRQRFTDRRGGFQEEVEAAFVEA